MQGQETHIVELVALSQLVPVLPVLKISTFHWSCSMDVITNLLMGALGLRGKQMADRQIRAVLGVEAGHTHVDVFAEEGKKVAASFDSQMILERWQKHSDV